MHLSEDKRHYCNWLLCLYRPELVAEKATGRLPPVADVMGPHHSEEAVCMNCTLLLELLPTDGLLNT